MTKKSMARQERDQREAQLSGELNGNNNWTDLHGTYTRSMQGLLAVGQMGRVLNDEKMLSHVQNLETLTANIHILTRDLGEFQKDLQHIFDQHKHRTGPATAEDVMQCYGYVDQYQGWIIRYEAVIMPTVLHILEETNRAELLMRQKAIADQAAAQAAVAPVV